MAIFKRTKKEGTTKAETTVKSVAVSTKAARPVSGAADVLIAPRVTEKAAILSDVGVYVFEVEAKATKPRIQAAIIELFKVTPRKITVVNTKGTRVLTRSTGKKGYTRNFKKAYVYLKKGDKIELA